MANHICKNKISTMDKKITIQLTSEEFARCLFIVLMILGITVVSNFGDQDVVSNFVDQKVIKPQILEKEHLAVISGNRLLSVSGKKAEHLYHPIIMQTCRICITCCIVRPILYICFFYDGNWNTS